MRSGDSEGKENPPGKMESDDSRRRQAEVKNFMKAAQSGLVKSEGLEPLIHAVRDGQELRKEIFDLNLFLLEFTRDHPSFFHQGYVSIDENANVSLANWKWIGEAELHIMKQLGIDTETFMKYNPDEGTVKQGVPLYPDIYQRLQRLEQLRAELAGLRRAAQTPSVAPPDPKPLQLVKKPPAFFPQNLSDLS